VGVETWEPVHIASRSFELLSRLEKAFADAGLSPWTWRIVLPPTPPELDTERVELLAELFTKTLDRNTLVHILSIECDSKLLDKLVDVLERYPNMYATVRCHSEECIPRLVRAIFMKNSEPTTFTRLSITLGPWIQTPYFPSTTNVGQCDGIAVAFRYVDLFEEAFSSRNADILLNYVNNIAAKLREVEKEGGVSVLGADYSLSPWMEESVAALLESLIEARLPAPGMYAAVRGVNTVIKELASSAGLKPMGFNEVMLPVAEDNVLKERVAAGELRVHHLIALSAVCVAGLDMVIVKREPSTIAKILRDMLSIQEIKSRSLGVRLIPVEDSPGSWIELGRFGKVPVSYT